MINKVLCSVKYHDWHPVSSDTIHSETKSGMNLNQSQPAIAAQANTWSEPSEAKSMLSERVSNFDQKIYFLAASSENHHPRYYRPIIQWHTPLLKLLLLWWFLIFIKCFIAFVIIVAITFYFLTVCLVLWNNKYLNWIELKLTMNIF